jgi:hypothetical protein
VTRLNTFFVKNVEPMNSDFLAAIHYRASGFHLAWHQSERVRDPHDAGFSTNSQPANRYLIRVGVLVVPRCQCLAPLVTLVFSWSSMLALVELAKCIGLDGLLTRQLVATDHMTMHQCWHGCLWLQGPSHPSVPRLRGPVDRSHYDTLRDSLVQ